MIDYLFSRKATRKEPTMNSMTDKDVMEFVRRGDRAAMSEIIRRYRDTVLTFCEKRAGDGAGEYLTAETFIVAARLPDTFYLGQNAGTWLIRIAQGRCRRHELDKARALVRQSA
jgi:DNA-directed RNA polymerase specialized sigma24 family protein